MAVGRVGRPHGLAGAFVVEDASSADERFAVGATLHVDGVPARVVESKRAAELDPANWTPWLDDEFDGEDPPGFEPAGAQASCSSCGTHGTIPCSWCDATGVDPGCWADDESCAACGGTGDEPCPDCSGGVS